MSKLDRKIPVQFFHVEETAAAVGPQNEIEPSAVLNEVQSHQNQNEILNVSDDEPINHAIPPTSDELSSMPTQRNRANNNVTVAQCYKMDHKNRGLCLIFSHQIFHNKHLSVRTTAPKEARMVKNTFERKGFRVRIKSDKTAGQIKKILANLENLVSDDDDCICICISTHGQEGILWAYDFAYPGNIFEDTLIKIKKLTMKPKLIFIQACRGKKLDPGVSLTQSSSDSDDQCDSANNCMRHPSQADLLIVHSTTYGYRAWRGWFFETLCKNLDMYGEEDDIDEILRKTSRKMCEYKSPCDINSSGDRGKQISVTYSTLTKKLFLKRS